MALCAVAVPATAQAQARAGVAGGYNLSEINVSGNESLNVLFVNLLQPSVGASFVFRLGPFVSLETDTLLSIKGSRLTVDGHEDRIKLTYVDVPVILRFGRTASPRPQVHVLGGLYGSYLIDATRETSPGSKPEVDTSDLFQQFDYGWVAGFGVALGSTFIDLRYSGGISNIASPPSVARIVAPSPSTGVRKFRNRGFSFVAVCYF